MRNFFVPHSTQMDRVAGAAVLHGDGLDVLGGGPGLALDAVYLHGFGRAWSVIGRLLGENG